jgi:hypothetical protein
MAEGKASRRKAWVMSEILDTIFHESGTDAAFCRDEARRYIMDYCGLTEVVSNGDAKLINYLAKHNHG